MIVLAGEDQNDCQILAELIRAHRPDFSTSAKLVRINDPVRLRRKTGPDLSAAVKVLVGKARAKALRQRVPLVGFVVHEDLDSFTDANYDKIRKELSGALKRQGSTFQTALALAAWESEAWLLLFPEAFPRVRPGWRVPSQTRGKDTGRIKEPKKKLKHDLGSPTFRESDGPLVARKAVDHDLILSPDGTNRSYSGFLGDLEEWG